MGITQNIVDAVLEAVAGSRVARVNLEIGKLSGVVPDSVRFCFDLVAQDTALEGAQLDIVEPFGRGVCRCCGDESELGEVVVLCPCGSADVEVLSGQQMRIKSVELE